VTTSPYEMVRAEEMLLGYAARWGGEPYEVLAVEAEFYAPIVNPLTGAESEWRILGGKIDVLARDERTDDVVLVEHKSTVHDISEGSAYWLATLMNSQLSTYIVGARQLGWEIDKILYDVLGRPQQRPSAATPVELRKYTKPTKAEPVPRLYASQRETDETPEEFRLRIREDILSAPDSYYKRQPVMRLEAEAAEAARDLWYTHESMRLASEFGRHPRNPDNCVKLNMPCNFLAACAGHADVTDPYRFRRVENRHEELTAGHRQRLPVLTNSEVSSFRSCNRLHHLRYDKGYRSLRSTDAQRSGTLVHLGLEGLWKGWGEGLSARDALAQAYEYMRREPERPTFLLEEQVA
jgi:hypothetical protein